MTAGHSSMTPPLGSSALLDLLYSQLHDHRAAASIGCLGALAEFHEPGAVFSRDHRSLAARSARGALAIELTGDEVACAYEAPSAHSDAWQYGIALLAPGRRGAARGALTELGPDPVALHDEERELRLFDLGLGVPNVDYCVRTGDATLVKALRAHCGTSVVAPGHALQQLLIEASPTRVVMSPLARIEVYQAIARDRTPQGSHTHLLPALAASSSHPRRQPAAAAARPAAHDAASAKSAVRRRRTATRLRCRGLCALRITALPSRPAGLRQRQARAARGTRRRRTARPSTHPHRARRVARGTAPGPLPEPSA